MATFNVMSLSSPEASLCCGEAGKKEKDSARGTMGKGKREESPLPYDLRFSGRICGSVVLAKPADYLDAFERCCEDNSLKGFSILFHGLRLSPLPIVPRALSIFSITAILIGIPSWSLCGGERSDVPFVRLGGHTQGTKLWYS